MNISMAFSLLQDVDPTKQKKERREQWRGKPWKVTKDKHQGSSNEKGKTSSGEWSSVPTLQFSLLLYTHFL